jgi:SpoVK/Ycf46/Vps4 family AAA+-type ATPase
MCLFSNFNEIYLRKNYKKNILNKIYMSQDIINIVNSLTNDAKVFYSKANTYRDYAELDGCLINLMLAANNLYQAINILNNQKTTAEADTSKVSNEMVILERGKNNYLDSKLCSNTQCKAQLETILRQILEEIRPLQQKQKSLKSSGSSAPGGGKDNDTLDCDFVKEVFLEGKENCIDFSDVVGCNEAKDKITESFINTFIYPNLFRNRTRAILFYGPPGTGKTMIVKAAINELKLSAPNLNIHFFAPLAADLKGKYVGETEKKIKAYFECASLRACESEQETKNGLFQRNLSILFLDEIEALAGSRSAEGSGEGMTSSVNTLLQMMDGVSTKPNLVVIGATNYPWKLDGAILRRFPTRIFIDLPTKEDATKLIFQEYADFVKINLDEAIGKYDEKERKFVKDEDKGYLLLKIKKDKDGNDELFDDIDQHCVKMIREKEDEELQLDNPKQNDKDSLCLKTLQKRHEKDDTFSSKIISKRSYEILFNNAYIGLLSYGLNLREITGQLLSGQTQQNHEEYIKKKKEFIYKKLVLDVSELAKIMVSKLFSNSDIRTFMRDRYFPLLSYESLKNEKKRYVVKINDRTFHVDKRSLDEFSPFFKEFKSTQVESDEYGNLLIGNATYVKYLDIQYSDLFQLEQSSFFDMYWVQPTELAEIKGKKIALPKNCVQYVNKTFLMGSTPEEEFWLDQYKSEKSYEKSTNMKLIVKLKGSPIFIETEYKYLCSIQTQIMRSFDEIYTNMKWYFNKDSAANQDYFQKITSLSIPDVSGANSQKIKQYAEIEKMTQVDSKAGPSRWSRIKKYFKGINWSGPWPRLRRFMYFFTSSTENKQKAMNDEFFEEEMRLEEFRKKEYENMLFDKLEKENKDYMSKILMNHLNLKKIFFVEEKKCISLEKLFHTLIEQIADPSLVVMSFMTAIEMTYFSAKIQNIQLEMNSSSAPEQIIKKRDELRYLIRKNFKIDRLIAMAVEKCLKSSEIQSYASFKSNFQKMLIDVVDNIDHFSLLFPNETNNHEDSPASIFVVEKNEFKKIQDISIIRHIPVWSGNKQHLLGERNSVLNCQNDEILATFTKQMNDSSEYIVYYKFFAGDNLTEIKTKLKNCIKEVFDKATDVPKDQSRPIEESDKQITNFNWEYCTEPFELQIEVEKVQREVVSENPKLFRTFQINPRYSIISLLNQNKKESYFQASTIKSDYAEMKYYEDTRIAPDTKERKKKAYKEMAAKYEWAKDLKVEE